MTIENAVCLHEEDAGLRRLLAQHGEELGTGRNASAAAHHRLDDDDRQIGRMLADGGAILRFIDAEGADAAVGLVDHIAADPAHAVRHLLIADPGGLGAGSFQLFRYSLTGVSRASFPSSTRRSIPVAATGLLIEAA